MEKFRMHMNIGAENIGVVYCEQPVIFYEPCYHGQDGDYSYKDCCVIVYADSLRSAHVGKTWACEEQDCYPNRSRSWDVSFTVVYKDTNGCAIVQNGDSNSADYCELFWIDLRR